MVEKELDIPVIKLFLHKGGYYMYDTYSNRLLEVSKNHFLELKRIKKIGVTEYKRLNFNSCYHKDVLRLYNKGLLQPPFIKKIEHPATKFVPFLVDRCINDVTLQVTQKCNFKCRYCLYASNSKVERTHKDNFMSWDVAKQAIDYLFRHSVDAKVIRISFYGGEPLLNFSLIKKTVLYAEELFKLKPIVYSMTSNGSIMNEKIARFLSKYDFKLTISLDGPGQIQNKHRKFIKNGSNTFKTVYDNVLYVKQNYAEYFRNSVTFNPVMLESDEYKDIICFFNELEIPIEKVFLRYANLNGIDYFVKKKSAFLPNHIDEENLLDKNNKKALDYLFNDKSNISGICHHGGPCVPALKYLFIDVNGVFYPCEKIIENTSFSIGNIVDGIDISKVVDFINIGKITENQCRTCWAFRFCDICISSCIDVENNRITLQQKTNACKVQKEKALDFLKTKIESKINEKV